jgi:hypothetical protein
VQRKHKRIGSNHRVERAKALRYLDRHINSRYPREESHGGKATLLRSIVIEGNIGSSGVEDGDCGIRHRSEIFGVWPSAIEATKV